MIPDYLISLIRCSGRILFSLYFWFYIILHIFDPSHHNPLNVINNHYSTLFNQAIQLVSYENRITERESNPKICCILYGGMELLISKYMLLIIFY